MGELNPPFGLYNPQLPLNEKMSFESGRDRQRVVSLKKIVPMNLTSNRATNSFFQQISEHIIVLKILN